MAFRIRNDPSAVGSVAPTIDQAKLDSQDVAIWARAWNGFGLTSGGAVTQRAAGANMSVDVAAGVVLLAGAPVTITNPGNFVIGAAHATQSRIDLVVVNSVGTISVVAGTNSSTVTSAGNTNAVEPTFLSTSNVLAAVYVAPTVTSIVDTNIDDRRIFHTQWYDYSVSPNLLGLKVSTGDLTLYSDAGGTQVAQWDGATGHIAIGTVVATTIAIQVGKTYALASVTGIQSTLTSTTAGGIVLGMESSPTASATAGTHTTLAGYQATVNKGGASTLTNMYGFNSSATSDSGVITRWAALHTSANLWSIFPTTTHVLHAEDQGGAGVVTAYGLRILTQTASGSNARNFLEDVLVLGVDVAAPALEKLVVAGHSAALVGASFRFYDVDNSNYVSIRAPAVAQSENWVIHLPADDPVVGDYLRALTVAAPDVTTEWATFDHGTLAGLSDDDHPQYLLTNGGRALTGNWVQSGVFGIYTAGAMRVGSSSTPTNNTAGDLSVERIFFSDDTTHSISTVSSNPQWTVDSGDSLRFVRSTNLLEFRLATVSLFTVGTSGNMLNAGYHRVGSVSAPTNTTAGDMTAIRFIGKALFDDDLDTSVAVENSADEDIIRFVTGGTARGRFSSVGLLLVNGSDLDMYTDDGTTRIFSVDGATGHANFASSSTPGANTIIQATKTFTDHASNLIAFQTQIGNNMTVGNAITVQGTASRLNVTGAFTASGLHSSFTADRFGSGTVTNHRGFSALQATSVGGVTTNRFGFYAADGTGAGAITNQYGVYIENMAKGGTLNRAIESLGGVSTHLGAFSFGHNVAPTAIVDVLQATLGTGISLRLRSTATNDDPGSDIYHDRVTTTDATVTTLHTHTIPATTTVLMVAYVVARRTGGTAGTAEDGAAYRIECVVKNVAGTATIITGSTTTVIGEDQAGWTAIIDVNGATARVRVTGATDNNVTWHLAEFKVMSVSS